MIRSSSTNDRNMIFLPSHNNESTSSSSSHAAGERAQSLPRWCDQSQLLMPMDATVQGLKERERRRKSQEEFLQVTRDQLLLAKKGKDASNTRRSVDEEANRVVQEKKTATPKIERDTREWSHERQRRQESLEEFLHTTRDQLVMAKQASDERRAQEEQERVSNERQRRQRSLEEFLFSTRGQLMSAKEEADRRRSQHASVPTVDYREERQRRQKSKLEFEQFTKPQLLLVNESLALEREHAELHRQRREQTQFQLQEAALEKTNCPSGDSDLAYQEERERRRKSQQEFDQCSRYQLMVTTAKVHSKTNDR